MRVFIILPIGAATSRQPTHNQRNGSHFSYFDVQCVYLWVLTMESKQRYCCPRLWCLSVCLYVVFSLHSSHTILPHPISTTPIALTVIHSLLLPLLASLRFICMGLSLSLPYFYLLFESNPPDTYCSSAHFIPFYPSRPPLHHHPLLHPSTQRSVSSFTLNQQTTEDNSNNTDHSSLPSPYLITSAMRFVEHRQ